MLSSTKKKLPADDIRAAKKAAILEQENKKRSHGKTILVVAVLLAGGIAFSFLHKGIESKSANPSATPEMTATEVSFSTEAFSDGQAKFFDYPAGNGISIRFFVLQSSDGVVRAAFDACDVCWRAGKGYFQEGDFMVCRNCGRRFASIKVNEVKGGCNPAPLDRIVENGKIVLKVADILEGKTYFDFAGRS